MWQTTRKDQNVQMGIWNLKFQESSVTHRGLSYKIDYGGVDLGKVRISCQWREEISSILQGKGSLAKIED